MKKTRIFSAILTLALTVITLSYSLSHESISAHADEFMLFDDFASVDEFAYVDVTTDTSEADSTVDMLYSPDGWEYTVSNGEIQLYGYSGNETDITVPQEISGMTVTTVISISDEAAGITSVYLPSGIRTVSDYAFAYCLNLKTVTMENGITSIGEGAFDNCISLTSITIPSSVTTIGTDAFCECTGLASVIISDGVQTIEDYAFAYCTSLKSVTIPGSVTKIGTGAFFGCSSLTSINIPNSVTTIGNRAFASCSGLKEITLSTGISTVGDGVFYGCSALKSVSVPSNVTAIGDSAFSYCTNLSSLSLSEGVKTIGASAFYSCEKLKKVTVPKSVTQIDDKALGYYYNWDKGTSGNLVSDFKIYCYANSAAAKYAVDNNIDYELLESAPTSIKSAVVGSISVKTYTGSAIKPTPSVKLNGKTLKKDTDYTLTYSNNTNAGTAKITVKGKGSYTGTVNVTFKISPASLSKAKVGSVAKRAYTGKAIKPTPSVVVGTRLLVKDKDYTLSYSNNVKTGKATILIKGKGNYSGSTKATFKIVPKKAVISSLTSPKTGRIEITWKKDTTADGYEIVYSTSSSFKSISGVTVKKNSTVSTTLTGLKKGKTYYIKVRSYKLIDGKKYYGEYSSVKKITCK